ncbi:hypothetical protein EB118_18715 [bacterium]|nr:hypothetical protein [bacterium]NDC95640.1 hypothetical protein [bacterium]NDD85348.1 hypothetical protein [bacterium]NDG32093.1 hypothetical protein [bacterium]
MSKINIYTFGLFSLLVIIIFYQSILISNLDDRAKYNKISDIRLIVDANCITNLESSYPNEDIVFVPETVGNLSEPFMKDNDVLSRIEMLKNHLIYNPSREWLESVLNECAETIRSYKNNE